MAHPPQNGCSVRARPSLPCPHYVPSTGPARVWHPVGPQHIFTFLEELAVSQRRQVPASPGPNVPKGRPPE